jgi:hypothetical protein
MPNSEGAQAPEAAKPVGGVSFRDQLAGTVELGSAQPVATHAAELAAGADPIAQLAQSVRSGALSPDAALQSLVDRAVGEVASSLSPAQRAELTGVLRAALETDPTLRELRSALE